MAGDLDFSVGVDTKGAVQSLKNLESSLGAVTSAFGALAGAVSLGALVRFSDQITSLKNSLTQFADAQANANDQFNALAAIAITSRSSLSAVGDLYSKIVRSADQLGISQAQAAQITETVSKALVVSGQSASSASGALLQLGQALASGTLQGDELRSILEGMPAVARLLADSLGVPVGALKQLGSAGQISAEQVVQALLKAKDVIDNQFAKTVPTITQAFEELKTSAAIAFNNFENSTQTGQNFAVSIEYLGFMVFKLSKNIDEIIEPLGTFLKIIGSLAAVTIAGAAIRTVFAAVAAAGGVVAAIGTAFTFLFEVLTNIGAIFRSVASGALGMGEAFSWLARPITFLVEKFGALAAGIVTFLKLDELGKWFKSLGDNNSDARKELEDYRKELEKMKGGLSTVQQPAAPGIADPKFLQQLDQQVIAYQRGNQELERRIRFQMSIIGLNDQEKAVSQAQYDLQSTYLAEINKLLDEYRVKSQSKNKNDLAALPEITKRIQQVTENYQSQLNVITELTDQNYTLAELEKRRLALGEFSIKTQIDGQRKIRDLQANIAKSTMTEIEGKYYDMARAAEESARASIDAENSRRRSLKLAEMTVEEEAKYYEEARKGLGDLKRAIDADYENSRKWSTGWKSAFNSYVNDATNAANIAKNLFNKTMQGMEDLIVNFVKTGKFEWKSFVASMAEELLRANIKQMLGSIFSPDTAMGGGLSSILGALSGTAGKKGDSANNPMFVYDISGGGGGGAFGGGAFGGAGQQGGGIFGTIGNVFSGIKNTVGNIFGGIGDAVGSVFNGVSNAVSGIGDFFGGGSTGGGGIGDLFSGITDFFGGFFANGGTIPGGKFGIVGERGPELVSGPASVSPLGGQMVTYNINAVDAQSFKAMIAADPGFIHAVATMGGRTVTGRR